MNDLQVDFSRIENCGERLFGANADRAAGMVEGGFCFHDSNNGF